MRTKPPGETVVVSAGFCHAFRTIIGYSHASTYDQSLGVQTDALKVAGCERIFAARISDSIRGRPEFGKLLDQLRAGEVIAVANDDRLARSLRDR